MLHTLKSPGGQTRLVWITVNGEQQVLKSANNTLSSTFSATTRRNITAFVIEKTERGDSIPLIDVARHHVTLRPEVLNVQMTFFTKNEDSAAGKMSIDARGCFRFYAGQLDPKDSSHFTIDYALDGQRGGIDGYLKDDDSIIFLPRTGRIVSERSDGKIWHPLDPASAAPPQ